MKVTAIIPDEIISDVQGYTEGKTFRIALSLPFQTGFILKGFKN